MSASRRTKQELALLVGYKNRASICNLLVREGLGSEPQYAKALAEETGSDPFLWLRGGDIQKRRMAFNKWSES